MPNAPAADTVHGFEIPWAEFMRVADWAPRFAPVPAENFCVRLIASPNGHRWACAEYNVVATLEVEDASGAVRELLSRIGLDCLDLPVRFVQAALHVVPAEADHVHLGVDPVARTLTIVGGVHALTVPFGDEGRVPGHLDDEPESIVRIPIPAVAELFSVNPAPIDEEGPRSIAPYVRLEIRDGHARFSRDLSGADLANPGVESIDMHVDTPHEVDLSFFPMVVMRELAHATLDETEAEFAFSGDSPRHLRISGIDWSMWVETGGRCRLVEGARLMSVLLASGWAVAERNEAVFGVRRGDTDVSMEIHAFEGDTEAVVRVECPVADAIPWSEALAAELNELNAAWADACIVHRGDSLVLVHDLDSSRIPDIGPIADSLAERARRLGDMVGMFL